MGRNVLKSGSTLFFRVPKSSVSGVPLGAPGEVVGSSLAVSRELQLRAFDYIQASSYSYVFAILNMFPLEF